MDTFFVSGESNTCLSYPVVTSRVLRPNPWPSSRHLNASRSEIVVSSNLSGPDSDSPHSSDEDTTMHDLFSARRAKRLCGEPCKVPLTVLKHLSSLPGSAYNWRIDDISASIPIYISSEDVVAPLLKQMPAVYTAYFKNPRDQFDRSFDLYPDHYPLVELEYPNIMSSERFPLLVPTSKDGYNPILDVVQTLRTISAAMDHLAPGLRTLLRSPTNHLERLQKAFDDRDGPLFKESFHAFTRILSTLKSTPSASGFRLSNSLTPSGAAYTIAPEIPQCLVFRIVEETYQRAIGLAATQLKSYKPFSSSVYGELLPILLYQIFQLTGLGRNSLFLDIGSGVGTALCQASLQTGCRSYGIELKPNPARLALSFVENFKIRCMMWGVKAGDIQVEQGDAVLSATLQGLIPQADVVLINNKSFDETLNLQLLAMVHSLKDGAMVVSLQPFGTSLHASSINGRLLPDVQPWCTTEHVYPVDGVSWKGTKGTYYIARVDREEYARVFLNLP